MSSTGSGNEFANGGDGFDTRIVDGSAAAVKLTMTFMLPPATSSGSIFSSQQLAFSDIERFEITGTAFNDEISGGVWNDLLKGGDGDDHITGRGGNDVIEGGDGNDTIDGGAGRDTLRFSDILSTEATWVRTSTGWTVTSSAGVDTLASIEYLAFTDFTVSLDPRKEDLTGDGTSDILWHEVATNAVGMFVMDSGAPVYADISTGGTGWDLA